MGSDVTSPADVATARGDIRNLRLGFVLPSVNTVVEPWLSRALPDHVSLHVARMLLPDQLTAEGVIEMDRVDGMRAIEQLASCRPASIIYGCVASSVIQGVAYDRHLVEEIHRTTGLPCETAIGATVHAMRALGLKRISVVSPYDDRVDAAEHAFLQESGFDLQGCTNFGIRNSFDLAAPSFDQIAEAARRVAKDADGVLLSCMNMRSHLAVLELENELGCPVVSATVASAWGALRLAGYDGNIEAFGHLGRTAW